MNQKFKILSLDGGGSWALIQLLTLRVKYGNISGHKLLRNYDLIVANSGGSIVLAALCEGYTIDEALDLFYIKKNREAIFSKNKFKERFFPIDYLRLLKLNFGPKYSSKRKKEAFEKLFPNCNKMQMNELPSFVGNEKLKILICTYDALDNRAKFFKSYGEGEFFDSVKLTQAIHGSSNAPIQYFDFPARFKAKNTNIFYELWDGALGGFNNPVIVGLSEAIELNISKKNIYIVSLGTGNNLMSMVEKKEFYEIKDVTIKERFNKLNIFRLKYQFNFFVKSILQQAQTILYQPPDWANYLTYVFLKDDCFKEEQFIRLSPLVYFGQIKNKKLKELIGKLYKLDMDIVSNKDIDLLKSFFEFWKKGLILNQPIKYHVTRENDIVYIKGTKSFNEAMLLWS